MTIPWLQNLSKFQQSAGYIGRQASCYQNENILSERMDFWMMLAMQDANHIHDDVIKWKHFSCHWPFVRGFHRSPVNSPHKGQWRRALMFSLICTWPNCLANNGDASDLRCHCAHYDATVMWMGHRQHANLKMDMDGCGQKLKWGELQAHHYFCTSVCLCMHCLWKW